METQTKAITQLLQQQPINTTIENGVSKQPIYAPSISLTPSILVSNKEIITSMLPPNATQMR